VDSFRTGKGRLVVIMVVRLITKVKQPVSTAVCRRLRRTLRRRLPSVARIEINRQVLAENLAPEKVRALQLAPVELIEGANTLIIEGSSIVVARAWITDPDAWKQLAQSVRAGTVRRFDATQLQLTD
jgi:hypothetical protein